MIYVVIRALFTWELTFSAALFYEMDKTLPIESIHILYKHTTRRQLFG